MRLTKLVKAQMLEVIEAGIGSIGAEGIWDEDEQDYILPEWDFEEVAQEIIRRLKL